MSCLYSYVKCSYPVSRTVSLSVYWVSLIVVLTGVIRILLYVSITLIDLESKDLHCSPPFFQALMPPLMSMPCSTSILVTPPLCWLMPQIAVLALRSLEFQQWPNIPHARIATFCSSVCSVFYLKAQQALCEERYTKWHHQLTLSLCVYTLTIQQR